MITNTKSTYSSDRMFGIQEEDKQFELLKSFFHPTLQKSEERYCKYDYKDDEGTLYELKTRKCS